jgi:YggT family protein
LTALFIFALSRGDAAAYVSALFTVYIVLIFLRIILSWVPSLPQNRVVVAIVRFLSEVTDPYLNIFRRFLRPVGGGGLSLDLSPIIAVILLMVTQAVVVGIIRG